MVKTLVTNIGTLVTGRFDAPPSHDNSLVAEDGIITDVGRECTAPDVVVDARGLTVIPGLVDGHVHPTVGEWTPSQNATGWVRNYLHGGTTSMVSAGELHVPELPFDALTPDLVTSLATLSRQTLGRPRHAQVKLDAGTLLLTPGLTSSHFDRMAAAGIRHLKFIFYDWSRLPDGEAQEYMRWARERGLLVKMHSGGVSRSGSSRLAGYDVVAGVRPHVVAHISGGPIPMPDHEARSVIDDVTEAAVEICTSMNYRASQAVVSHLASSGQLCRLTLGTDTPGGTGVVPRGMLRNICFLASLCGVSPENAIAAATGNTAAAHGLAAGELQPGKPADLVILGPIQGSMTDNALESFQAGDLPGISTVLIDGVPAVKERSEQTPPPRVTAKIRSSAANATLDFLSRTEQGRADGLNR